MKIGFLGMTHLGLNYLAASAQKKFEVIGFDQSSEKISKLKNFFVDVKEPYLKKTLLKNKKRISFSSDFSRIKELDLVFISLDLKTNKYGQTNTIDLKKLIKIALANINSNASLIILSQVKPGFVRSINFDKKRLFYHVETLIFGLALERALKPERIIVGCENEKLSKKYKIFLSKFNCPIFKMNYESAELTKISINIFLASSINVTNLLARTCNKISADWSEIVPALRSDKRIGKYAYLDQGLGISGGNLERDLFSIKSIIKRDRQGEELINAFVKNSLLMKNWAKNIAKDKIKKSMAVGIIGLAYKDKTDSVKNSPSIDLIKSLKSNKIFFYDSYVNKNKINLKKKIIQIRDLEKIIKISKIIFFMTKWKNTKNVEKIIKKINLKEKFIIDPYQMYKKTTKNRCKGYYSIGS